MSSRVEIDADWRAAGLRYYAYNFFLRPRFGGRVHKVSLDAGLTCPNVDGTVASGGCTFCDNRSFSPSRRLPRQSIAEQLEEGIRRVGRWLRRRPVPGLLSTSHEYLCPRFDGCGRCTKRRWHIRKSSGMAIGTRPDCVPDDVLDLLSEIAGADVSLGRIRHANDPRPLAGLDESRPSSRRISRRDGSQPRPRIRNLCRM